MDNYSFDFNPKDCNKVYFDELFLLLNAINPEKEKFKRIKKKSISNIKCENNFNSCKPDNFFFENKKQIILGRFFDTIGCFYKCKGHYFSMAMEPYSLFKNDVFIRYIIDKPEIYINNSKKIELEDVFPIRIVMSDKHNIPTYADKKLGNIKEYTFDNIKKMFALSTDNLKIINGLPNTSILKKIITESFPINHIISRELCILYYMKLHFYVVENDDKTLKPFILVSKYNLEKIKKIYDKFNKPFPNIKELFKKKNKTLHKPINKPIRRNKTQKNIKQLIDGV
jgi:hypothetical protein